MLWKKYNYLDYGSLFIACALFVAGCILAAMSLGQNAPGIYPFLFMLIGSSGLIFAYCNQVKMVKTMTEFLPLLSPKMCEKNLQQEAALKQEISETIAQNTDQRQNSEAEICTLNHPDVFLKPSNLTNCTSENKGNAEDELQNVVTCIVRDIEHNVDICHELYTFAPSPGGSSSRKAKMDVSEKMQRKRMPPYLTAFRQAVAKAPSSQFYVPSMETTALIAEESDSDEHSNSYDGRSLGDVPEQVSEQQSNPSSSLDPIYENLDSYGAEPTKYSEESLRKNQHDFQKAELELRSVEGNRESPGCAQSVLNIESMNPQRRRLEARGQNTLKYRVGEFTSPERIYANILPPLEQIHKPSIAAEHVSPKLMMSNLKVDSEPRVKTLLQLNPEKIHSDKFPLEETGHRERVKAAIDFNSNTIESYKDSPAKETNTKFPSGEQRFEDNAQRVSLREAGRPNNELKVPCCKRFHAISPYKNESLLEDGNINLEITGTSLSQNITESSLFKRNEERKYFETENLYENLPSYSQTILQKLHENSATSPVKISNLQSDTNIRTIEAGSLTEQKWPPVKIRSDQLPVAKTESSSSEDHSAICNRDTFLLGKKTNTNKTRSGITHVSSKGSVSFTFAKRYEPSNETILTCEDNVPSRTRSANSESNINELDSKLSETDGRDFGIQDTKSFAGARRKLFASRSAASERQKLGNIPKMKSRLITVQNQMPLKCVTLKRETQYENLPYSPCMPPVDSQCIKAKPKKSNEAVTADINLAITANVKPSPSKHIEWVNPDISTTQIKLKPMKPSLSPNVPSSNDCSGGGTSSPLKVSERVGTVSLPSYQSNFVGNTEDERNFSFKKNLGEYKTNLVSSVSDSKDGQSLKIHLPRSTDPYDSKVSQTDNSAVLPQKSSPDLLHQKTDILCDNRSKYGSSVQSKVTRSSHSPCAEKSDDYLSFKKYLNECKLGSSLHSESKISESRSSDQAAVRIENILDSELVLYITTEQSRSLQHENKFIDTLSVEEDYVLKPKHKLSPSETKSITTAAERASNQASFNLVEDKAKVENRQSHSQLLSVSRTSSTSPQKSLASRIKSYFPVLENTAENKDCALYSGSQLTGPPLNLNAEARETRVIQTSLNYPKEAHMDSTLCQDQLLVSHYDSPSKLVKRVESEMRQTSPHDKVSESRTDCRSSPQAHNVPSLEEFVKSYYDSPKRLQRVNEEMRTLKQSESETEKRIHSPDSHKIITSTETRAWYSQSPLKEARHIRDNISPCRTKQPPRIFPPLDGSVTGSHLGSVRTTLSYPKEAYPNLSQTTHSQDQFSISHYDSPPKLLRPVEAEKSRTSPSDIGSESRFESGNSPQTRKMSPAESVKSHYDYPKQLRGVDEEMKNLKLSESEIEKRINSQDRHLVITNIETKESFSRSPLKEVGHKRDSRSSSRLKTPPLILPPLNSSFISSDRGPLKRSLSYPEEAYMNPSLSQAKSSQDQFAISHYDSPTKQVRCVESETSPTSTSDQGNESSIDSRNSTQTYKLLSFEEFMKSYYDSPKRLQRIDEEMKTFQQSESKIEKPVHSPVYEVIPSREIKKVYSHSPLKEPIYENYSIPAGRMKTSPTSPPVLNVSHTGSGLNPLRVNLTTEQSTPSAVENRSANDPSFPVTTKNDPDSSCSADNSNLSCANSPSIMMHSSF